jgi:hypothetical protein
LKKDSDGRWMDDNNGDWTDYVSGPKAPLSGRLIGWDMPDRDLAIINTGDHTVTYVSRLMNICMDVAVNPVTGKISVVGTDAINEVRFEPQLNGRFLSVEMALIDPVTFETQRVNLNPHLTGSNPTLPEPQRLLSIGDPRQVLWTEDGSALYVAGMGSNNLVKLDIQGRRILERPIQISGGLSALVMDAGRHRLFGYQRFTSQLTVLDMGSHETIEEVSFSNRGVQSHFHGFAGN